jgi:hypothetical protein
LLDVYISITLSLKNIDFSSDHANCHLSSPKPSGGTVSTILSIFDVYSLKELGDANKPYGLSPIPGPLHKDSVPRTTKLLGVRYIRDLGIQTTYIFASAADRPLVHRSWGLLGGPSNYGPNFEFNEYKKTQNYLTGTLSHLGLVLGAIFVSIPFVRAFIKRFVIQPGDGPTKEEAKMDFVEYKGIAKQDVPDQKAPRAFARATFSGSGYDRKSGLHW